MTRISNFATTTTTMASSSSFHHHHHLLLFLLLLLSILPFATPDEATEKAALLELKLAVARRNNRVPWNQSTPLCDLRGVNCTDGTVFRLTLPAANLRGTIPTGIFGKLTSLRYLSLRKNALSGSLPSDLASCTQLQELYLSENRLSGDFPAVILSLTSLTRLVLSGNNLSGPIPANLTNLKNLVMLLLERNQLSGKLPDLDLPKVDKFNVSYNLLNGSVPRGLRRMAANAFLGMSLCDGPFPPCTGEGTGEGKKKLPTGAIVGIAVGINFVLLVVVAVVFLVCRRRKGSGITAADLKTTEVNPQVAREAKISPPPTSPSPPTLPLPPPRPTSPSPPTSPLPPPRPTSPSPPPPTLPSPPRPTSPPPRPTTTTSPLPPPTSPSPRRPPAGGEWKALVFLGNRESDTYKVEDLLRASAEVLGKGTFGTTYKAAMENDKVVATKRLKVVEVGEEEFRARVEAIGGMEHPNVVGVEAYNYSGDEKLLVYKYMPMGSLSALLHGIKGAGRVPLIWPMRLNIAFTAARGIEYIHSRGPDSCHGNIKSSNILITQSYDAVISDQALFQLAKPIPSTRASGYLAPEVNDLQRVTQKGDVYSFGVLLLEMLTGKEPGHSPHDDGADLLKWVRTFPRDECSDEVFDMELLKFLGAQDEMEELLQIAINCCEQPPDNRPTMSEIVRQITEIQAESDEPIDGEDSNNISPPLP